jgi:hypothetical protein
MKNLIFILFCVLLISCDKEIKTVKDYEQIKIKAPIENKINKFVSTPNPLIYKNPDNTLIYGYYNNYNIPLSNENRNNIGIQYRFNFKKEK